MSTVPPHELGYTVGLIVGEGSFFVTIRNDDRYQYNVDFGPKFSVTMGEFSRALLEGQQALYNIGTVNRHSKGYTWVLSSRGDCRRLVELLDGFLAEYEAPEFVLSPKFVAYQKWRAILDLLDSGKELAPDDIRKLARFREEINHISGSGQLSSDQVDAILDEAIEVSDCD
ncbi:MULTISPECIES: LAGLIDADG family homing endonuclease [unclassified Haloferax]|uniref:LAGLIDADG family homing endonuclease n=1 Tax=unclassified Haloferax TaxID=2625095 RepID=UPI002875D674|nr:MULTISPECIES: LAGLIDADG family homing endonuclease [unclassified Haloferax]MDS0243395.1 LAGLIDADG family homing endonuclease [Haloferax sp. S2CR25]MDS0446516.1 LAGLIDADG family homing endonuclease [Haloferax sp. S2CR25-2]